MNEIEELELLINSWAKDAITKVDKPRRPNGAWWLDIQHGDLNISVEWRPDRGFGVSVDRPDVLFGEGPDEVFEHVSDAAAYIRNLIRR